MKAAKCVASISALYDVVVNRESRKILTGGSTPMSNIFFGSWSLTVYTCVLVDLAYKPTPLFVVHFQVFKFFYNLANPAILSMFYVIMSDKL